MCLDTVESTKRDRKRKGFGWKVFRIENGCLRGEYYGGLHKVGVWLKSRDDKSKEYPLGFHIFRTRAAARGWKSPRQRIRKVRFRDVLAEGIEGRNRRIIVAKEMMIL